MRREEDEEDADHNGMDDDYDYDDRDEDDSDDDDDNFGANDKGWGPQMKCQTHDAGPVGINSPNEPLLPCQKHMIDTCAVWPPQLVQESIIKQILPRNTAKAEVTSAGTTQLSWLIVYLLTCFLVACTLYLIFFF